MTITLELELRHSPEKVWRALTEPQLLAEWLLPVLDLKLERGAAFRLQGPQFPDWDGIVHCKFVEIEPQRKLSYSWAAVGLDTVVTFTLTPTAAGTHLLLVQSGFTPEQKQAAGGARYGWKMMSERLVALLERT